MRAILSCVLNVNRKLVGYCLSNRMNKASKPGLAAAALKSVLSAIPNIAEVGTVADGLVDVLPTPTKSVRDKKEYK